MIVVKRGDGVRIVRQLEHARMCGELASHWDAPVDFAPPLWDAVVVASEVHDDGWTETENDMPSELAVDFKQTDADEHVAIWRRSVSLAEQHGNLVTMLVALHARWLYTRGNHASGDAAIEQELVDDLTQRLAVGIDALPSAVTPGMLWDAQQLVSFFDAVSLALIGGIPRFAAWDELVFGRRRETVRLEWDEQGARMHPWGFVRDPLTIRVMAESGQLQWVLRKS